ncbi:MAG: efflux RND transporter periplasmic adaptor subunit, partial [Alphaproteobacteria bacterium]
AAAAELQRARATYQAAASELERAQTLIQRGNISGSTLDQRTADEARSEADVNAAEAALQRTRLDFDYTKITAPFAGRIGRATYDVGNLVGPDSGVLATLVDLDPIYVTFPVSERDLLTAMQARRTVDGVQSSVVPRLRLSTGDMYDRAGRIEFLDNRVDPTTGTVAVRAQFANPDQLLLPGQFVTVVLSAGTAETRAVIPQAAVQENQAGRFVLVVGDDDRVDARQVVAGQRLGTDWVIEDGLEEGELVVVEGLQKVRPGARVRPVRAGEAG